MHDRDLVTGGDTNTTPRPETRAGGEPARVVDAFVSRAALVEFLRHDAFNPGEGFDVEDCALRRGWNQHARHVLTWLGVSSSLDTDGFVPESDPVGEEEARLIAVAEAAEAELAREERDAEQRAAEHENWRFAFDVEQFAIEDAYRMRTAEVG